MDVTVATVVVTGGLVTYCGQSCAEPAGLAAHLLSRLRRGCDGRGDFLGSRSHDTRACGTDVRGWINGQLRWYVTITMVLVTMVLGWRPTTLIGLFGRHSSRDSAGESSHNRAVKSRQGYGVLTS